MSVTFSFQKTMIAFPPDHHGLSGLSFDAYVTRRLSLLNLDFILPPVLPIALHWTHSSQLPSNCGLSDADWASDEKDQKSISGYCFFYLDSLVSSVWKSSPETTKRPGLDRDWTGQD